MCLGIPAQVVSIDRTDVLFPEGEVEFGGLRKSVNFAYIPNIQIGDYVMVHVGFAISRIDEQAAQKTFELLKESYEP